MLEYVLNRILVQIYLTGFIFEGFINEFNPWKEQLIDFIGIFKFGQNLVTHETFTNDREHLFDFICLFKDVLDFGLLWRNKSKIKFEQYRPMIVVKVGYFTYFRQEAHNFQDKIHSLWLLGHYLEGQWHVLLLIPILSIVDNVQHEALQYLGRIDKKKIKLIQFRAVQTIRLSTVSLFILVEVMIKCQLQKVQQLIKNPQPLLLGLI